MTATHTCHRPGCGRPVQPKHFACSLHWMELPYDIRDALRAAGSQPEQSKAAARRAYDWWRERRGLASLPSASPKLLKPGLQPTRGDAELVHELAAIERGLTEWEVGFVDSVVKQVEAGRRLSEKQRSTAEKVLSKLGR